ncbi:MAG: YbaN family protein [Oceanicoccus sp.]
MRTLVKHYLLITIGWTSIVLGVIGVFLPILPTTPFILLSAWCFSRSSERFHSWLLANKHFGRMISDWEDGRGLSRKVRTRALILSWFSLCFSMLVIHQWWAVAILSTVGILLTLYLYKQPVYD